MKPDPKNLGRHARIIWPGQREHGQIGEIIQVMEVTYVILVGCCAINLVPEQLVLQELN